MSTTALTFEDTIQHLSRHWAADIPTSGHVAAIQSRLVLNYGSTSFVYLCRIETTNDGFYRAYVTVSESGSISEVILTDRNHRSNDAALRDIGEEVMNYHNSSAPLDTSKEVQNLLNDVAELSKTLAGTE